MNQLIQAHPELVQLAFVGLLGLACYLYKQNESNSAKLIAEKLDQIVLQLNKLFLRDELKTTALAELSERVVSQEQRCTDRLVNCPGKVACKELAKHKDKTCG